MDPTTAALFAAASVATSVIKNKAIKKAQSSQIKVEAEMARLNAAESALARTQQYRESLAYNAALSGMGIGGETGFTQISNKSASVLEQDMKSIARKKKFIDVSEQAALAGAKTGAFVSNVSSAFAGVSMANDLGLFSESSTAASTAPKKTSLA